jgi:predicted O-methyltransferase YrrM
MITRIRQAISRKLVSVVQAALEDDAKDIERERQRQALAESARFVDEALGCVESFETNFGLLTHALGKATAEGLWAEFGVYSGKTINFIAKRAPGRVFGFDSFEGLPEDWRPGFAKGRFAVAELPKVEANVELVKGWFDKTLSRFLEQHDEKFAFVHMDCDLYSSTKTVLTLLSHRLVSGSVVVFDEFFNYPGWREGEFRAFSEFVQASGATFEYVGYCRRHEQVAVRLLSGGISS